MPEIITYGAGGFRPGHPNVTATATVELPVEVVNEETIRDAAHAALATNRTFLAIASPSAAQVAAQVKALTRQNQGIIRLLLGQLEDVD